MRHLRRIIMTGRITGTEQSRPINDQPTAAMIIAAWREGLPPNEGGTIRVPLMPDEAIMLAPGALFDIIIKPHKEPARARTKPTKQKNRRCVYCGKPGARTIVLGGYAHKRCY